MSEEETLNSSALAKLTSESIAAYVSNSSVQRSDLPRIISEVHAALSALQSGSVVEPVEIQRPAVRIKKSITPDYLISLEDGNLTECSNSTFPSLAHS